MTEIDRAREAIADMYHRDHYGTTLAWKKRQTQFSPTTDLIWAHPHIWASYRFADRLLSLTHNGTRILEVRADGQGKPLFEQSQFYDESDRTHYKVVYEAAQIAMLQAGFVKVVPHD